MLQSTHYSLKLAEGSDIVNPLVVDRPNYETIDSVMYDNESASIGTATELKSGTIHALTRAKGNTNMFRFTATSNYDLGDTFTVDSVPVTALLPNGTAIPDKGYVVNSTVLCSLVGTLLTVYTSGSALADDSLKLGGELPTYYAKQSDMTSVQTLANSTSLLAQQNEADITAINNKLSEYVETTANGSETARTVLNRLYALVDKTKLTPRSCLLVITSSLTTYQYLTTVSDSAIVFGSGAWNPSNGLVVSGSTLHATESSRGYATGSSGSTMGSTDMTTNYPPSAGTIFRVRY